MSTKNIHIIQKQVIDITLPDATAALEWEANKRHGFTNIINRELEKCFDEYDKANSHFIIEKLDIDLGILSSDNLQVEMPGRLHAALLKSLEYHLNTSVRTERLSGMQPEYEQQQAKEADHLYNEQQGKLEVLYFFLNRGYLPWWGSALANWDETWLQQLTENEINTFRNFLAVNDDRPIQRISTQFNDGFIAHLLQRFGITDTTEKTWNWLRKILEILPQQPAKSIQPGSDVPQQRPLSLPLMRTKYWFSWIAHATGKTKLPDLHSLFEKHGEVLLLAYAKRSSGKKNTNLFDEPPPIWKKELDDLKQQAKEKKLTSKKQAKAAEDHPQIKKKENISPDLLPGNITDKKNQATDNQVSQKQELLTEDNSGISEKTSLQDQFTADKKNIKSKVEEETDALFVDNAGLVLLHPFLPQLFRNCGWLDKNKFFDDYAQTMAVYALYYLATGNTEAMEHELIFPKFLAGINWELPLEPVEPLNDIEKATCDELLQEILKHWEPLRNTSTDGLRESFLQRNGKLEHIYSGWRLSIEHKTLDILLSRLPWGISLIKLPWMPEILTVTWQ